MCYFPKTNGPKHNSCSQYSSHQKQLIKTRVLTQFGVLALSAPPPTNSHTLGVLGGLFCSSFFFFWASLRIPEYDLNEKRELYIILCLEFLVMSFQIQVYHWEQTQSHQLFPSLWIGCRALKQSGRFQWGTVGIKCSILLSTLGGYWESKK